MNVYHFVGYAATSKLSLTLKSSNSSSDWKVRTRPLCARSCGFSSPMSVPSNTAFPADVGTYPVIASMKVVSAPFGPINPTIPVGLLDLRGHRH